MHLKSTFITILAIIALALSSAHADDWDDEWDDDFDRDAIARLVAPIALYPDAIVSQILVAATYPLEVVEAARWLKKHPHYRGQRAVEAAEAQGWDPSVQSLVAFPELLQRMSQNLRWLQRLGEAFLTDEAEVLAVIQDLRQQADQAGRLDEFDNIVVVREPRKRVIVLEPRRTDVIYLPYYDPYYVFAGWHYIDDPIVWYPPHHHHFVRPIFWTPGFRISFGLFWTGIHWHHHRVIIWQRPRHIYRYREIRRVRIGTDVTVWRHNPRHRRGAIYRSHTLRTQYPIRRQITTSSRVHPDQPTRPPRPAVRPNAGTQIIQRHNEPRSPRARPPHEPRIRTHRPQRHHQSETGRSPRAERSTSPQRRARIERDPPRAERRSHRSER